MLGWLKEWDKCVYKRVNPLQTKKRARETEELGAGGYVGSSLNPRALDAVDRSILIISEYIYRAMHLDDRRRGQV